MAYLYAAADENHKKRKTGHFQNCDMSSKPIILLVTGAWHIPDHYSVLSHRLRHLGFTVECPRLLTNNNALPPNKTLNDDISQIRSLALSYLDDGKDVVPLMHSYGGIVGTSAFAGLGSPNRKGQASIKTLIYMTSFIPFEHESLADIFGGALPSFLSPNEQGTIDIYNAKHMFYHDLPPEQQDKAVAQLVVHPTCAQFDAPKILVERAAWRDIPVTYLFCDDDQALPEPVQAMMVNRIEKDIDGLKIRREHFNAGHSPFLSMPDRVAEVVIKICEAVISRAGVVAGTQEELHGLKVESNLQVEPTGII